MSETHENVVGLYCCQFVDFVVYSNSKNLAGNMLETERISMILPGPETKKQVETGEINIRPFDGKYRNNTDVQPSLFYRDFE